MKIAKCVFEDDDTFEYCYIVPNNLEHCVHSGQYVVVESGDYQIIPYSICRVTTIHSLDDVAVAKKATRYVTAICDNYEVDRIRERAKYVPDFIKKCQQLADKFNGNFEISTNDDVVGETRITCSLTIDG